MNTFLIFVLGTLSGSVLIGIIYTIFWMVKTHRSVIKNAAKIEAFNTMSNNNYQSLYDKIKDSSKEVDDSICQVYIRYDGEVKELHKYIESETSKLHTLVSETDYHLRELHYRDMEDLNKTIHSYIDSRIDKQYDRINVLLSEIGQRN